MRVVRKIRELVAMLTFRSRTRNALVMHFGVLLFANKRKEKKIYQARRKMNRTVIHRYFSSEIFEDLKLLRVFSALSFR